jgi:hypothetical protein
MRPRYNLLHYSNLIRNLFMLLASSFKLLSPIFEQHHKRGQNHYKSNISSACDAISIQFPNVHSPCSTEFIKNIFFRSMFILSHNVPSYAKFLSCFTDFNLYWSSFCSPSFNFFHFIFDVRLLLEEILIPIVINSSIFFSHSDY